ncbi:MAG: TRAP transporter fused permease subunit [Alphaproteobacteria bacterium]|nr:TRAP transporter fused permease subunit [Alphaproteobacteria bacterium]
MDEGNDRGAHRSGWTGWTARVLAFLLTLAAVGWAADIYRTAGMLLYNEQFNAFVLALALALVFLTVRARRGTSGPPPWYDIAAGAIGMAAALYVAYDHRALNDAIAFRPLHGVAVGGILLALVFEGLRRVSGNVLTVILLFFIAYGFFGHLIPGEFQGRRVSPDGLLFYLAIDVNGVFGSVFGIACTIVVTFLLFGSLLGRSGGANFFTDLATAVFGGFRGGAAKISVVASSLFGTINGNAVANVVATGVVTIPLMKQSGYKPEHAGAIEAVASTGGQLMPPVMGAAAFIMAELLGVAYREIVIAATVPALLYYGALFIQADLEAAKSNIAAIPKSLIVPASKVLSEGWYFILPFAVLIGGLFWLNQSPETAALYASIVLIGCGLAGNYRGNRMQPKDVLESLVETGRSSLDILMIAAAAGFIIGVLNVSGLSFALTIALVKLGAGNMVLLLVLAAGIAIVLGMGMPTVGVYVLLAALVAPALTEVGVPALAAHLFVLYFGMMSMTTPPVAVAAFAAASIAQADPIRTGLAGVKFGWSAYIVPFLFVASPTLLMQGQPHEVTLAVVTAMMGVYLVSVGVAGFMTRPIGPVLRIAFAASGLAMMVPANAFPGAIWTDIAGFVAGAGLIVSELGLARRLRQPRREPT